MTDEQGLIEFRSVKPAGYPIPVDGPVGELLRMQGRHNMRPAHIHFLINKEGYKTQFSQVYSSDDPHVHSDVQFGVTHALLAHYERHEGPGPQRDIKGVWYTLEHTFVINKGEARLPKAPIQGKNTGELPEQVILRANH
jgi:catechol 1,2-dioxygenase